MSTELTKTQSLSQLLKKDTTKNRLEEILGARASTFATAVVQIANSNEMLKNADPNSVLSAAILSATLDLPLNNSLGQAYIVPFKNKQKDGSFRIEAQFQIGAKGLQQLAIRSGQYSELDAKKVYEGQVVDDDSFTGYHFEWKNKKSDKIIGYASYFKLLSGFSSTFFMSVEEVEAHAKKYSQTYKNGFGSWKDNFDAMALKTVIKLLLNSGKAPLSIEMRNAITADQSILPENYNGGEVIDVEYADHTEDIEAEVIDKKQALKEKKDNPTKDLP